MISKEEFKLVGIIVQTEQQVIIRFQKLIDELSEPQIKSEFQSIISTHRNHLEKIKNVLENKNEK